jgi:hypothetical protein
VKRHRRAERPVLRCLRAMVAHGGTPDRTRPAAGGREASPARDWRGARGEERGRQAQEPRSVGLA